MSWNDLFVNMDNTNFFNFSFLPKYGSAFVRGFEYTLLLAVVSVLLAVIPALLLAMMRLSKVKPIKWFAGAYIAVFRSTPMLVQLSIIYFGLFHYITLPRTLLFGFIAINRFIPGVVALALNSSAYVAEIFRAGILAVDKGQTEAARSLGLSGWQSMRLVVLPQAIKNVLPALANEVVTMVKESSICSMLARGALISAAVIILLLPPVLCVCEPVFHRTSIGWRKPRPVPAERAALPEPDKEQLLSDLRRLFAATRFVRELRLTGGEPLLQAEFVEEFFAKLHEHGVHTALDTSGVGNLSKAEKVLAHTDLVLCDLKFLTKADYLKNCRADFDQIERFLQLLRGNDVRNPLRTLAGLKTHLLPAAQANFL